MPLEVIVPRSMRIGEIFTVLLGFGLATLAIGARTYTKLRITRKFLSEDCMLSRQKTTMLSIYTDQYRFFIRGLRTCATTAVNTTLC